MKTIILNHKNSLEYDEVYSYINYINSLEIDKNIIVLPSNLYLETFINNISWGIGAQNFCEDEDVTGEVSSLQLKSLGVEYSMVGHYERVKYFNEDNACIKNKLNICLDSNISPILCFGETGNQEDIKNFLDYVLEGIENIDFIIFAYEPLMLESVPSVEEIREDISFIYDYLYDKYKSIPNITYGGGVREDNIKDIMNIEKLNGVVVGSISSEISEVKKLIDSIDWRSIC